MKKFTIIVLAVLVLISISGISMATEPGTIKIGATGGLNIANTNHETEEGETKSSLTSFNAGVVFDYWFQQVFALEVMALYNNKGAKFKGEEEVFPGVIESFNETDKLAYLSFMVLPRFAFGQPGGVRPFIKAGFELGILLSAKATGDFTSNGETQSFDEDFKDDAKSTEFAIPFGAGVMFPIGENMTGVLQATYSLGLTGIVKDTPSGFKNPKNKVIMINFLFYFWSSLK